MIYKHIIKDSVTGEVVENNFSNKEILNVPAIITPIINRTGRKNFLSNVIFIEVKEKNRFASNAPNSHGRGNFVKVATYPPIIPIIMLL